MVETDTVTKLVPRISSLDKSVKNIQHKLVCDSIRNMVASGNPPSLARVEAILAEMELSLNRDIGERIARFIPAWFEAKHVIIPLRYIKYDDYGVSFPINSEGVSIPSRLLPFDSSNVLNRIKSILEGNLEAFIDKKFYFQWDLDPGQLTVEHAYILKKKIKVDEASLRTLKKVEEFRVKRGYRADAFIGHVFSTSEPARITGMNEYAKKLVQKDKDYNKDCIAVLMKMAEVCYITDRDFWFKVGDVLIWEEPRYSKATYIFKWPEEPLHIFIFRTWISELQDIRNDPESGFMDRAIHVPNITDWQANVEIKIRNEEAAFTLGKVAIQ